MQSCANASHCCRKGVTHLHLQISFAACVGSHLPNLVFCMLFSVWIPSWGCKLVACCTASATLHAISHMPLCLHRDDLTVVLTSSCTMTYLLRSVCQQPCLQTLTICFVERVHLLDAAVCPGRYSTSSFCRVRLALTSKSIWSRCSSKSERLGVQSNH